MKPSLRSVHLALEMMKVAREEWLTNWEIVDAVGIDRKTAVTWTKEMEAQGLLLARTRVKQSGRGVAPREYTLTPEWGGKARA